MTDNARDWAEDVAYGVDYGGCYCRECAQGFLGHGRRLICKACANPMAPAFYEFAVSIDWNAPRPAEVQIVIARDEADAKAIAASSFRRSHTSESVIEALRVVRQGPME